MYVSSGGKQIFNTKKEVKEMLKKKSKGITTALTDGAYRKLKYNVANDLYRKRKPSKYYERTNEFSNSIVKGKSIISDGGDSFTNFVEFDSSLMTAEERRTKTNRVFNAHMDFYGNDFTEEMFAAQEYGYKVPKGKKRSKKIRGIYSLRKTIKYLDSVISKMGSRGNDIDVYSDPITGNIQIITNK